MIVTFSYPGTGPLDYNSPAVIADPYPFYAYLRAEQPVYRVPGTTDYMITRYEDVKWGLTDANLFSNRRHMLKELDPDVSAIAKTQRYPSPRILADADAPIHTGFKAIVQQPFTPKRVRGYEVDIQNACNELVDALVGKGSADICEDFAYPLVLRTLGRIQGLPAEKLESFAQASIDGAELFSGYLDRERALELQASDVEYLNAIADIVEQKRREPGDDMISEFLQMRRPDGTLLTDAEVMELTRAVYSGGSEGPAQLIANTVLALLQTPSAMSAVLADRSLLPKAIDEAVRIDPPAHWQHRWVMADTEIRGVTIPANSRVLFVIAAANRDPDQFADPDSYRLDRDNLGTHLSFGRGIHSCFGMMLARSLGRIALNTLFDRLPNLRFDIGRDIVHGLIVPSRRLLNLHVRFG